MSTTFSTDSQDPQNPAGTPLTPPRRRKPRAQSKPRRASTPTTARASSGSHHPSTRPTDAELQLRCRETLLWVTTLAESGAQVSVQDGRALLTGTVRNTSDVETAVEALRHIPGLAGVRSELRLAH